MKTEYSGFIQIFADFVLKIDYQVLNPNVGDNKLDIIYENHIYLKVILSNKVTHLNIYKMSFHEGYLQDEVIC